MEVDFNLLPEDNYMDLDYNYVFEFKDTDLDTTTWTTRRATIVTSRRNSEGRNGRARPYVYLKEFGGKLEMVIYNIAGCSSYLWCAQEEAERRTSTWTLCTTSW